MDYEAPNSVKNRTFPSIAIPRTSGMASEVTGFTIITDTTRKKKLIENKRTFFDLKSSILI